MLTIPIKYKIPLVGKVNKGMCDCIDCNFKSPDRNVTPYIIGFAETTWGNMIVWECPHCFTKQYFHLPSRGFNHIEAYKAHLAGGDSLVTGLDNYIKAE